MNINTQIEEKLLILEEKLFLKHNVNTSARAIRWLIEDELYLQQQDPKKLARIQIYFKSFENIFQNSFYVRQGKKESYLNSNNIEYYSILKYFFDHCHLLLNTYSNYKLLDAPCEVDIENAITGEKIELTKNHQKVLSQLLNIVIWPSPLPKYALDLKMDQRKGYIVSKKFEPQKQRKNRI